MTNYRRMADNENSASHVTIKPELLWYIPDQYDPEGPHCSLHPIQKFLA
jgi:hypothetical protein